MGRAPSGSPRMMLSGDNLLIMTDRRSREQRRSDVVEAALELLADVPLERLSTRQLARELGLSQPALFRHFRSKEGILLAVVERVRTELGHELSDALGGASDPVGELEALVGTLFAAVEARPGLPRLLFSLAGPVEGPVHSALFSLAQSQRRLVQDRIEAGQRRGLLRAGVDSGRAATHLIGLVQGVIFQWVAGGRTRALRDEAGPLMGLWLQGASGDPTASEAPRQPEPSPAPRLVFVDGRALLAEGVDPLGAVLEALAGAPGAVLRLDAPFHPAPLVRLLEGRKLQVEVVPFAADHHGLLAAATAAVDLRGLEAPEPLEQVLIAVAGLDPGDAYLARTPRVPRLLLQRLQERGLGFDVREEPDGSALLLCWAP